MAESETTILVISSVIFVTLLLLTQAERRRGRRLFAIRFRGFLDRVVEAFESWLSRTWNHFVRYILQLNWYYSIHSVLKATLLFIQSIYLHFERMLERNRNRTRELRKERREHYAMGHLREIAEHKEDTALTPAQQRKLKEKKLEEKH